MKTAVRVCQVYLGIVLIILLGRTCVLGYVAPGHIGVRFNNVSGLLKQDLGPGWHVKVGGLHTIHHLPSSYLFLNYTDENVLSIRTKDNNTVSVDVSVPYRIIPGMGHAVVQAGNHLETGPGRYRFERFAHDTTISVLREQLAQLKSADFYNTDRRLEVATDAAKILNERLNPLHLQASEILIRAAYFRPAYENQLAQIQLNEQQKLLDGAKQIVANERQKLDNFVQKTAALVAAKEQDWARRIAELDRAYQVGLIDTGEDRSPGAARRELVSLSEEGRAALVQNAAELLPFEADQVTDAHLLGIKNIQAETTEYDQRVRSQADGISARLRAEGEAMVAKVNGAFEGKLNRLLDSPGGRAYVSYRAADNVKFNETLTFQSGEGIPAILRLRDFALQFMGQ